MIEKEKTDKLAAILLDYFEGKCECSPHDGKCLYSYESDKWELTEPCAERAIFSQLYDLIFEEDE